MTLESEAELSGSFRGEGGAKKHIKQAIERFPVTVFRM
jgi:hypothetical protein